MSSQPIGTVAIRNAAPADAEFLAAVYNYYVRDTVVTFEEEPVAPSEMQRRIEEIQTASLPWLVAEREDGVVVGYAYAVKWRPRWGYRFASEVTVYLAPDQGGRGIGSLLYAPLLTALRERRFHAAMGGIALPNDASVALHEKFGFRKVAQFDQVGFKFNRWIDVGYWQLLL